MLYFNLIDIGFFIVGVLFGCILMEVFYHE